MKKIKNLPQTGGSGGDRVPGESLHRVLYSGRECVIPEVKEVGWDRFRAAAPGGLSEHFHPDVYEFCYLAGGSVDWWVEDSVHEVRAGDVYLTHPAERHGGMDGVMHPCELYWVQVNFNAAAKTADPALLRAIDRLTLRSFPASAVLRRHFDALLAEHKLRTPLSPAAVRGALASLLVMIVRDHDAHREAMNARAANSSAEMSRALAWLEEHAAEDFSIEELAGVAGLSASQFHERFLKAVGFTPGEYRSQIRVRRAKRLLREGKRSVTDIAFDLGFSSSQYFATVFRRHSGLTPRQYQRRASIDRE